MSHENSETVETDGRFYNINGRTGERLKPIHPFEKESYDTLEEALSAAYLRSLRHGLGHEGRPRPL